MAMNRSADPCQDFFQFACGTWNKKHLIPEDRSSISTFEVLADQLQIILKGMHFPAWLIEIESRSCHLACTRKRAFGPMNSNSLSLCCCRLRKLSRNSITRCFIRFARGGHQSDGQWSHCQSEIILPILYEYK